LKLFDDFPDCCEGHRKLKSAPWFKKEEYSYLPLKLVRAVNYSWFCINKNIDSENWRKSIADYIQVTARSFGQFPDGFGNPLGTSAYLNYLAGSIESSATLSKEKQDSLLKIIDDQFNTSEEDQAEIPDIAALDRTYSDWIKAFPFELSFFRHLKPHFDSMRPFVRKVEEPNMYSGLVAAKLTTVDELVKWLIEVTGAILTEINTLKLHETGKLTDTNALQLELLLAERRQKLKEGYFNSSPDASTRYRRILKNWFKDEKQFIKELVPLLKAVEANAEAKGLPDSDEHPGGNPVFSDLIVSDLLRILAHYFSAKHQGALDALLTKGQKPKTKLFFKGSGNALADAFKQLYEAKFIAGCSKKQLQNWIAAHFQYEHLGDKKNFTPRYLKDIISTDANKCASPLINIIRDKQTGLYKVQQS
jgi:hypothetical protein